MIKLNVNEKRKQSRTVSFKNPTLSLKFSDITDIKNYMYILIEESGYLCQLQSFTNYLGCNVMTVYRILYQHHHILMVLVFNKNKQCKYFII